jgi:hypothetical protein
MKKVLLFVAVVGFIGMTSCKKDHDCACTTGGVTTVTTFENSSKSDAQDACDALNALNSIGGGSCTLN